MRYLLSPLLGCYTPGPPAALFVLRPPGVLPERGPGSSRVDVRDRDPPIGDLDPQGVGERVQGRLGCAVSPNLRDRSLSHHRGDVDDASASPHVRQDSLHAAQWTEEFHLEEVEKVLNAQVFDTSREPEPRVVDQDIHRAELPD